LHNNAGGKNNLIIGSEEFISDIYENHSFLELNNPAKMSLATNFFRAGVHIDSLFDKDERRYFYKTALYEIKEIVIGQPPFDYRQTTNVPLSYSGKYATGRSLQSGVKLLIRNTGWGWRPLGGGTGLDDAEPFGVVYRPLDNMLGLLTIGCVFDTLIYAPNYNISNLADARRAMALASTTLQNNIILFGFDWRHYADISKILLAADDFNKRNSNDPDISLSISLYGFDAIPVLNRVDISWNTLSECNISRFELERANVYQNRVGSFATIDKIDAISDNSFDNSYNVTDRNLAFGASFAYRLRVIDFDGNTSYSENRIVSIENALFNVGDITPNPVGSNNSSFDVISDVEQHISISIFDLSGRSIMVLSDGILRAGVHTFEIDSSKLHSGTYTVIVRNANHSITKAFTVVK
jgi:hypothetical protein